MSLILSDTAQAWWNADWTVRKKITLDTSATGTNITEPIGTTVVLVRLHDGDFSFSSAKDDGSDIRFIAGDDKTPLNYEIEKYDSLLGEAFVWVKVPDLKPGAPTSIWLYYGNAGNGAAPGGADARATYDNDTVLVYHFAGQGTPAHDSTKLGNDSQNPVTTVNGSLIGPGLRLDGKNPVTIPAKDSLAWTEGGALTWSAWINSTAAQPKAVLFSRRDGTKSLVIGLDNNIPFIEINGARSAAGAAIAPGSWHHLAAVANGATTTLYLDGAAYGTVSAGPARPQHPHDPRRRSLPGPGRNPLHRRPSTNSKSPKPPARPASSKQPPRARGAKPPSSSPPPPTNRPRRAGSPAPSASSASPQIGHHRRLGRHRHPGRHVAHQLVGDGEQIPLPQRRPERQRPLPEGMAPRRQRLDRPRPRRPRKRQNPRRARRPENPAAPALLHPLPHLPHRLAGNRPPGQGRPDALRALHPGHPGQPRRRLRPGKTTGSTTAWSSSPSPSPADRSWACSAPSSAS